MSCFERVRLCLATFLLMACGVTASAEAEKSAGSVTFENDLFFGTDHYYTDGVQFERSFLPVPGAEPAAVLRAACVLLGCSGQTVLATRHRVGQLMYTPRRIGVPDPQPEDRPWAGLLYYQYETELLNAEMDELTSIVAEVGVTGPRSYAEQTQKFIHKTFTGVPPQGWRNQIGSELGLLASVERRHALRGLSHAPEQGVQLRTTAYWRFSAGNIMTYAAGGLEIVIGKDLPLVAAKAPGITPKSAHPPKGLGSASRSCVFDWLECTARFSVEARAIAFNVFLDGPMFRDDGPSVDRKVLVMDALALLRLDFPRTRSDSFGPWFVQFQATRRTPEFHSTAKVSSQSFGALTIGTDF